MGDRLHAPPSRAQANGGRLPFDGSDWVRGASTASRLDLGRSVPRALLSTLTEADATARAHRLTLRSLMQTLQPEETKWGNCTGGHPEGEHRSECRSWDRLRKCGRVGLLGGSGGVIKRRPAADGSGYVAYWGGLVQCGSIWACPVCSAKIRYRRGLHLAAILEAHLAAGGGALFLTATIRHNYLMPLAATFETVSKAWRGVTSGSSWQRDREQYGITAWVRSVEITHTETRRDGQRGAGWHPHIHTIILTERPLTLCEHCDGNRSKCDPSTCERVALENTLWTRWHRRARAVGGPEMAPSRERGIRLDPLRNTEVAHYLTKIQDREGEALSRAARELARADTKTGRAGSRTPFQILADTGLPGRPGARAVALWQEYEAVSKGKRAMAWGGEWPELPEDHELLADPDDDATEVVCTVEPWELRWAVSIPGMVAAILSAAETLGEPGVRALLSHAPKPTTYDPTLHCVGPPL